MPDIKVDKTNSVPVVFNRVINGKEAEINTKLNNADIFTSDTIQKNPLKMPEPSKNILNKSQILPETYSKMAETYAKLQDKVNLNKQLFIDISDKLAAIYGEKEKDIKDKLSDVFKRLAPKQYNSLSEIDTAMQQNTNNKDGGGNVFYAPLKKKKSSRKWINYKLFEIFGEILAISRYIRIKLKNKHKNFKRKFYKEFKRVKEKIIYTLNKIESMIESDNKFN